MSMVYVGPVIMVFVFIGYFFYMKKIKAMTKNAEQQHAGARAGEIAKRIGLTVVQGDPNTNLMYAQALAGQASGDGFTMPETHIRLEGAPNGRQSELVFYMKKEVKTGMMNTTLRTTFDGHLSMQVRSPFPDFEVVLRAPASWLGTPKMQISAPIHSFHDPMLDKAFVLRAADPRVGPVIAEALRTQASAQYLHVYGTGGVITVAYSLEAISLMGQAEQAYFLLDQVAGALEQAAAALQGQVVYVASSASA